MAPVWNDFIWMNQIHDPQLRFPRRRILATAILSGRSPQKMQRCLLVKCLVYFPGPTSQSTSKLSAVEKSLGTNKPNATLEFLSHLRTGTLQGTGRVSFLERQSSVMRFFCERSATKSRNTSVLPALKIRFEGFARFLSISQNTNSQSGQSSERL
jgi:hypothetical protein